MGIIIRSILLIFFYSALTLVATIVFPAFLPGKVVATVGIVAATFGSWSLFSILFAWLLARTVRHYALLITTVAGILVTLLHIKLVEKIITLDQLVGAFEGRYGSGTAYAMVYGPYLSVFVAFVVVGYIVQRTTKARTIT